MIERKNVMNEELLMELITEIKALNEKIDILISDKKIIGYTNLESVRDDSYEVYGSVETF